jgi:hypothetical protein
MSPKSGKKPCAGGGEEEDFARARARERLVLESALVPGASGGPGRLGGVHLRATALG